VRGGGKGPSKKRGKKVINLEGPETLSTQKKKLERIDSKQRQDREGTGNKGGIKIA